jgi:hypothetical protein
METQMFNRETALLAVVAAVLVTPGILGVLSEGSAQVRAPLPVQIDTLDPMSNVWSLPDQTIENQN